MYQSKLAERNAEAARLEKDEIERANNDYKKEIASANEALNRKLASAKSAEDIAKAKVEMEAATKEAEDRRAARARVASARRGAGGGAMQPEGFKVKGVSTGDDALGGLRGK